ncbi:MAG: uncharacterized protein JWM68_4970 [Verrucomicrobiales bacterium]|nr:uncharacterized protein [Verrucomicrobiales bacterium]
MQPIVCIPKSLTSAQAERAVRRSIEINPENAAALRTVERTEIGRRGGPRRLALLIGNRWPASGKQFSVQFLDNPSKELRSRILLHMNAWNKTANVRFEETKGTGTVRIARLDGPPAMAGYWSYVGTQILGIEEDQPTLNLEGFTMKTPESEFRRVVRHEAGHTLGFEHEHMRAELIKKIDRKKAFVYFDRTQGWTKQETLDQVLTPLLAKSIMGTTESDPLSVMCYEIPAEITKDGKPIVGGVDINEKDFTFAASVYPKAKSQSAELSTKSEPAAVVEAQAVVAFPAPTDNEFHIVVMDGFDDEGDILPPTNETPIKEKKPKYARVFASFGGARVTSSMRLHKGKDEKSTAYGRIIRIHERIKNYTNRVKGSLPSDDEMIEFGGDLFETLFQGDVRRLYDEARARQQNGKLNIVLTSMIPWIAEKPWEFAYDTVRKSFLATEEIHLLRNVMTAVPANTIPPTIGPLQILVVSAQPVGLGHLSVEQEVEVIRRGFEPLIEAGLVTVEVLARATPGRIHGRLSTGKFSVVHFIGHGTFDEEMEEGALIFEDDRGGELRLGERSVREIFCQRGVSMVFLNACQSGSGGRSDFNKGIAQSLVAHGLPALVANQYSVLDSSATSFAQHFYWAVAQGMSIGKAACEARIAVNYSLRGELIDWAVPVVYARDPNMTMCARVERTAMTPSTSVRATTRRAVQRRAVRVAVWDIDNLFPSLEQTIITMNSAQSVFGFEVVAMSTPIDAWDLEERAEDGTPYLWAEKLARRLERMTVELRVDILACVTSHWLRDDNWLNLYGWWPDSKKPPVVIFSCAGFDDLPAEGNATDRVIANVMVTLLAGFLSESGTHDHGSKICPLAFNQERDIKHLTGQQRFDKECISKLKKLIPNEFPALDALLKTFP